ncbi:MAG: pyrimidine dimer DNA glycosylase/endonuclease V [Candidatus Omnitrophota bacterium]
MRIWDIDPKKLCRQHLLGEHRELHAIWTIITQDKKGYAHHPETKRWRGKLKALYLRHKKLVCEMKRRSYTHKSKLCSKLATGASEQKHILDSISKQKTLLRRKKCSCKI